jgi:hypothetical protein
MTFNIKNMLSEVGRSGIAHAGYFNVQMTLPLQIKDVVYPEGLSFRTDTVDMPGRALMALDNYYDYGVTRNIPYAAQHQEVGISIILSEDMREKELFDKWQDLIVGGYRNEVGPISSRYDVGYYDEYVSTINISRFRPEGQQVYSISLVEAYPRTISALPMSWDSIEALRINIQFSYRYYKVNIATNAGPQAKIAPVGPLKVKTGADDQRLPAGWVARAWNSRSDSG